MRTTTTASAALLLAAGLLTGCGGDGADARQNAAPSATAPTSTTATPTASPDGPAALQAWYDDEGSTHLDTLSTDLDAVETDLRSGIVDDLTDSCATLTANVETIRAGDTVPDKMARHYWEKALEHLETAASECTTAAVSDDQAGIDRMAAELQIGAKHMGDFVDRLNALNVG